MADNGGPYQRRQLAELPGCDLARTGTGPVRLLTSLRWCHA
jgi:hypothetical protein